MKNIGQVSTYCDECGEEIQILISQKFWKMGNNYLCSAACVLSYLDVEPLKAGEE